MEHIGGMGECAGIVRDDLDHPEMCSRSASTREDINFFGGFELRLGRCGGGFGFVLLLQPRLHLGVGQQI